MDLEDSDRPTAWRGQLNGKLKDVGYTDVVEQWQGWGAVLVSRVEMREYCRVGDGGARDMAGRR